MVKTTSGKTSPAVGPAKVVKHTVEFKEETATKKTLSNKQLQTTTETVNLFDLCKNPEAAHKSLVEERAANLTWDDFPIKKEKNVSLFTELAKGNGLDWEKESISNVLRVFLYFVQTRDKKEFYKRHSCFFHGWGSDGDENYNYDLVEAGIKTYKEQWRWLICASRLGVIKTRTRFIYKCWQEEEENCWFKAITVPEMLNRFTPHKFALKPL